MVGFKAINFNKMSKNRFGSKKTTSIKTDKFDGKDIEANEHKSEYDRSSNEEVASKYNRNYKAEKPDYYKHTSGEYKNTERLKNNNNTNVSQDFLYDRSSKSKTMTSKDGELKSYDTVIAKKTGNKEITVTDKKYSSTSSKQVSQLKAEAERNGYTVKVGFEAPKENNPKVTYDSNKDWEKDKKATKLSELSAFKKEEKDKTWFEKQSPEYQARVKAEENYYNKADERYEKNLKGRKVIQSSHDADLVEESSNRRVWVNRVSGETEIEVRKNGKWEME